MSVGVKCIFFKAGVITPRCLCALMYYLLYSRSYGKRGVKKGCVSEPSAGSISRLELGDYVERAAQGACLTQLSMCDMESRYSLHPLVLGLATLRYCELSYLPKREDPLDSFPGLSGLHSPSLVLAHRENGRRKWPLPHPLRVDPSNKRPP